MGFSECSGTVATDQSLTGDPMDLTLSGNTVWNAGENGVVMTGGKVGTDAMATKLISALQATNRSTFELWVVPANLTQSGPARLISVGGDPSKQNFVLGQIGSDVQVRLLHTAKDRKAKPRLTVTNVMSTTLTHIVHIYDGTEERLYINGVEQPQAVVRSGSFANWDATDKFSVGNEATSDRPWHGTVRLVAVYDRALTPEEILQNYMAGPSGTN